jgi:hypothetical protein
MIDSDPNRRQKRERRCTACTGETHVAFLAWIEKASAANWTAAFDHRALRIEILWIEGAERRAEFAGDANSAVVTNHFATVLRRKSA